MTMIIMLIMIMNSQNLYSPEMKEFSNETLILSNEKKGLIGI